MSHNKAIMLRRLVTLLPIQELEKKKIARNLDLGRFECRGIFGVPKEVRTRTLPERNPETIPLKINRPLTCNTEEHLEVTEH
jgi:hypothetical protein